MTQLDSIMAKTMQITDVFEENFHTSHSNFVQAPDATQEL